MNIINDILQSDLLERYAIGNVSDAERNRVVELKAKHPEIASELEKIELALERMALDHAIAPPVLLKADILNIPKSAQHNLRTPIKKWLGFAASLLTMGLIVYGVMNTRLSERKNEISRLESKYKELEENCTSISSQYAFLNDAKSLPITLSAADSDNRVVVYWNEDQEKSLMRIVDLPQLENSETYQLWADVNGKMLDLGIFDSESEELIAMGFYDKATSLNITIEPAGGSDHPTVSRLVLSQAI